MKPSRHQPNQLICGINQTPYVYVSVIFSFMLLLFFLARPTLLVRSVGPDLPRVWHPVSMPHANREDAIIVTIARDGQVFFRSDRVRPELLPDRIRESLRRGSEKEVYIRADGMAKYGWVAEVLYRVRSAGVEKIGFLVYEKGHVPLPSTI